MFGFASKLEVAYLCVYVAPAHTFYNSLMDHDNIKIPLKVLCKYLSFMFSLELDLQLHQKVFVHLLHLKCIAFVISLH